MKRNVFNENWYDNDATKVETIKVCVCALSASVPSIHLFCSFVCLFIYLFVAFDYIKNIVMDLVPNVLYKFFPLYASRVFIRYWIMQNHKRGFWKRKKKFISQQQKKPHPNGIYFIHFIFYFLCLVVRIELFPDDDS